MVSLISVTPRSSIAARQANRAGLRLPVIVYLLVTAISGTSVFSQGPTVTRDGRLTATVREYNLIPEATEPCTPEECGWWDRLRSAGNELQKKGDEKSKKKFALLFAEGLQKAYRVPLKDRPPQVLAFGRSVYLPETIARLRSMNINGAAELSVEYRAEGSVGEVKVTKSLDNEFDKGAVQATRQDLFLPAVKNGTFVTEWQKLERRFSTRR